MTARISKQSPLIARLAAASAIVGLTLASATYAIADNVTLKVAYSADYQMSTPDMAKKWFGEAKTNFEKANPGVTVQLVPIPGSYDDFLTKLSLMYQNPDQAPDVAEVPAPEIGQWVASDLLMPLDDYLAKTAWWPQYVEPVKKEATIDGKFYGASNGVNVSSLLYDKGVLAKAGLPADWKPKTWNEILDAARAIKKSDPNAWPLWVLTGTAQGTSGMVLGVSNLVAASSDPNYFDASSGKWTVDSKGLREVLTFYKTAASEGLFSPASQMLNANGAGIVAPLIAKHQIGISLVGNYVPQMWNKDICSPCWPDSANFVNVAPLPTSQGQAPGIATAFSGWSLAMAKSSKNPDLAFKLIDLMMQKDSALEVGNYAGLVPAIPAYNNEKAYVDFAPQTQTFFANLTPYGQTPPSNADYKVWAFALEQATETLVLHPDTSVDDVVGKMKDYVAGQLGDDKVEVRN